MRMVVPFGLGLYTCMAILCLSCFGRGYQAAPMRVSFYLAPLVNIERTIEVCVHTELVRRMMEATT